MHEIIQSKKILRQFTLNLQNNNISLKNNTQNNYLKCPRANKNFKKYEFLFFQKIPLIYFAIFAHTKLIKRNYLFTILSTIVKI